jgi:N-methylhydantoinase A/oxoprolinase/acetone carboxylase beta subunit
LRAAITKSRSADVHSILIDGQPTPCTFLWRGGLAPGYCAAGPVVVEEETATTFVPPGWRLSVDGQSNLLLERAEAA